MNTDITVESLIDAFRKELDKCQKVDELVFLHSKYFFLDQLADCDWSAFNVYVYSDEAEIARLTATIERLDVLNLPAMTGAANYRQDLLEQRGGLLEKLVKAEKQKKSSRGVFRKIVSWMRGK